MKYLSMHVKNADMSYRPRFYCPSDETKWDEFLQKSRLATFLHSRRFLSYHGKRYFDRSIMMFDENERLCAVMPAAIDPESPRCIVSHPGATYGGLLLSEKKSELELIALLPVVKEFLANNGFDQLVYKSVPQHLHKQINQVDSYVLWSMGAMLDRRDLWNIVDLSAPALLNENRQRQIRRAKKNKIDVVYDVSGQAYERFYPILAACLRHRHNTVPVHSLADMQLLQHLFNDNIELWLALSQSGKVIAGEWIFKFDQVYHYQYGAATLTGRQQGAQDLLLHTIIGQARKRNMRYFSFGASTEQQGRVLNKGLFNYKAGYGTDTVVQDFYNLQLCQ